MLYQILRLGCFRPAFLTFSIIFIALWVLNSPVDGTNYFSVWLLLVGTKKQDLGWIEWTNRCCKYDSIHLFFWENSSLLVEDFLTRQLLFSTSLTCFNSCTESIKLADTVTPLVIRFQGAEHELQTQITDLKKKVWYYSAYACNYVNKISIRGFHKNLKTQCYFYDILPK